jgi:hypothetical protein
MVAWVTTGDRHILWPFLSGVAPGYPVHDSRYAKSHEAFMACTVSGIDGAVAAASRACATSRSALRGNRRNQHARDRKTTNGWRCRDGVHPPLFSGLGWRCGEATMRIGRPGEPRHDAITVDFEDGMEAQQLQLDTISHNLANVSTNGYKRSHAVFEDLMYQNLRQAGAASSEQTALPTGLQVGPRHPRRRHRAQPQPGQPAAELEPARRRDPRQRPVRDPAPGRTTGYTRDGSFQVSSTGQLVTNNGYIVQPGITIPQRRRA